jgi:fructokinase
MDSTITIVGFGAALWDMLPGGKKLGGAPLNVACRAQQLAAGHGGRGVVASQVGNDTLGGLVERQFRGRQRHAVRVTMAAV